MHKLVYALLLGPQVKEEAAFQLRLKDAEMRLQEYHVTLLHRDLKSSPKLAFKRLEVSQYSRQNSCPTSNEASLKMEILRLQRMRLALDTHPIDFKPCSDLASSPVPFLSICYIDVTEMSVVKGKLAFSLIY